MFKIHNQFDVYSCNVWGGDVVDALQCAVETVTDMAERDLTTDKWFSERSHILSGAGVLHFDYTCGGSRAWPTCSVD